MTVKLSIPVIIVFNRYTTPQVVGPTCLVLNKAITGSPLASSWFALVTVTDALEKLNRRLVTKRLHLLATKFAIVTILPAPIKFEVHLLAVKSVGELNVKYTTLIDPIPLSVL